jgi:hypothetical protein
MKAVEPDQLARASGLRSARHPLSSSRASGDERARSLDVPARRRQTVTSAQASPSAPKLGGCAGAAKPGCASAGEIASRAVPLVGMRGRRPHHPEASRPQGALLFREVGQWDACRPAGGADADSPRREQAHRSGLARCSDIGSLSCLVAFEEASRRDTTRSGAAAFDSRKSGARIHLKNVRTASLTVCVVTTGMKPLVEGRAPLRCRSEKSPGRARRRGETDVGVLVVQPGHGHRARRPEMARSGGRQAAARAEPRSLPGRHRCEGRRAPGRAPAVSTAPQTSSAGWRQSPPAAQAPNGDWASYCPWSWVDGSRPGMGRTLGLARAEAGRSTTREVGASRR